MQNDTNYWSDLAEYAETLKTLKKRINQNRPNYPIGGFIPPQSQEEDETVILADKLKSLHEENKEYIKSLIKGNSVDLL